MGEKETWVRRKDGSKHMDENFVKCTGEKRWVKKKHG